MSRLQIVQSIQRLACTKCGAEANASCNCGVGYEAIVEDWAKKREQHRQQEKARRERKAEEKQQLRGPTDTSAADRAEARCAAQYKAFTAQEERNAVSDILEAIRGLSDEQRALLFQTLKESYQWTT